MTVEQPNMKGSSAGPWAILVVTDSVIERKLLAGLLSKHGHRLAYADTAAQALQFLAASAVDVVLTDALLPDTDAREFIGQLRKQTASGQGPIVVLLADDLEDESCDSNADVRLNRPFTVSQFHERVEARQHAGARTGGGAGVGWGAIDWQVALDAVGGRKELLSELVEVFFTEYPSTLAAIQTALDNDDPKALQLSAHQLKGCLRYFGPTRACELARLLEDQGRAGELEQATEKLNSLRQALELLVPELLKGPQDS